MTRYNQSGQLTQTIEHDTIGLRLYSRPCFITESNNGDVVVSDSLSASGAVVVTDRNGRHRLSYTGLPPGSVLEPRGICTDSSLYILVCDVRTKAVHMLDSNGRFLSFLRKESEDMGKPNCLNYDINTHHIWVGRENNKFFYLLLYNTTGHSIRYERLMYCLFQYML